MIPDLDAIVQMLRVEKAAIPDNHTSSGLPEVK